ncbi:hypothetical protein CL622_02045 [archaeon]|nr:hypothetical protein [archaeon]|tara:strand:+ start:986 stop:1342 length:357 start_codon:yes stop_codon:yes gene_type:complete
MYIKDLQIGMLIQTIPGYRIRFINGTCDPVATIPDVHNVYYNLIVGKRAVKIQKIRNNRSTYIPVIMIYMGSQIDYFWWMGTRKHHTFMIDDNLYTVSGYDIKHLTPVDTCNPCGCST